MLIIIIVTLSIKCYLKKESKATKNLIYLYDLESEVT